MAVVATTTYLYVNSALTQFFIQGSELTDRGLWSSSTFYAVGDVVQIGVDQYIALTANVNTLPTGIVDENWSTLVVVEEVSGTTVSAGSDAYARALAGEAYFWGTTAFHIGTDAYNLAVTGTNLVAAEAGSRVADVNNIYIAIGSLSGSVSVDLAGETGSRIAADLILTWAGTDLQTQIVVEQGTRSWQDQNLQNQITTEQGTRSWQDQVLANAIVDEAGSRTAADQAIVAFVFGSIAVDLSAETGSRIAADLALTWAGTNESTTRQSADQQIITIVETGTNTANSAWALAQLGTIIPPLSTLPDVSIPAPTAQQVLSFDGSVWIAVDPPSTVGFGGFTFFLDNTPSGTLTYDTLTNFPTGGTESVESVVVTTGSGPVVFMNHLSDPLNRTRIDAGVWEFNTYATVDTGSAMVGIEILVRSINGSETSLFNATTGEFTQTTPVNVTLLTSQGSYPITLTDKLLARYSGTTTSASPVTLSIYHQGTAHDSHFHSPLIMSHNDLDGLQGGTTDQFYHTTLDQNQALTGNLGYPSASNPFVTVQGLNYASGTLGAATSTAQSTANSAYYVAQSGSNTANDAYIIACIGTNVAMTGTSIANSAYSISISGSTTANNAWTLAQQLAAVLGMSLSGTINLYTSQLLYGKPDTRFTIINGVVAGLTPSYMPWEDFEFYGTTTGTTPISEPMYRGSSWDSYGTIWNSNLAVGFVGTEAMNNYSTGTLSATALNAGTGWSTSGTQWGDNYSFRFAIDGFEQYAAGTLSASGTEINSGTNWIGTAQIYAR